MRKPRLDALVADAGAAQSLRHGEAILGGERRATAQALRASQSQLGQDLFALDRCGWKRDGWFVEFGATDGRTLSNTWMLETCFGWTGILAEPARVWRDRLAASGRTAQTDHACVWARSGETLEFAETDYAELSTIRRFASSDSHRRDGARTYPVPTISLLDLLRKHQAPQTIDYLSIDTEGSEVDILSAFDFSSYRFNVITCEHNHTENREKVRSLLEAHGYVRTLTEVSDFDDWYVHASLVQAHGAI